MGAEGLLKNSLYVIPEVFIGNPVSVKSICYGFPLSREWCVNTYFFYSPADPVYPEHPVNQNRILF